MASLKSETEPSSSTKKQTKSDTWAPISGFSTIIVTIFTIIVTIFTYIPNKQSINAFFLDLLNHYTREKIFLHISIIFNLLLYTSWHFKRKSQTIPSLDRGPNHEEIPDSARNMIHNIYERMHGYSHHSRKPWKTYLIETINRKDDRDYNHNLIQLRHNLFTPITTRLKKEFQEFFALNGWDMAEDLRISIKCVISKEEVMNLNGISSLTFPNGKPVEDTLINAHDQWVVTIFRDLETLNSLMSVNSRP